MIKIDRSTYFLTASEPWTFSAGSVGIEVGDVQDSGDKDEIPIHVAVSIKEFWIKIPDTPYEINFQCTGADIRVTFKGIQLVAGSAIGTTASPFSQDILIESSEDLTLEKKSGASIDAGGSIGKNVSAKIAGQLGFGVSRKKSSKQTKKKSSKPLRIELRTYRLATGIVGQRSKMTVRQDIFVGLSFRRFSVERRA